LTDCILTDEYYLDTTGMIYIKDSYWWFMSRCILDKIYELNVEWHLLLTDFKQAYDSTNRTNLKEILKEFGIPKILVGRILR